MSADLKAIRARAEAASQHWSMGSHAHPVKGCRCGSCWQPATLSQPGGLFCDDVGEREHDGIGDPDEGDRCDQFGYTWPDADFIVHARDDMLALLGEVDRLRAHVDLTDAAIAYVDATEGTDEVEQCWHELNAAVDHYRAVMARREEAAK